MCSCSTGKRVTTWPASVESSTIFFTACSCSHLYSWGRASVSSACSCSHLHSQRHADVSDKCQVALVACVPVILWTASTRDFVDGVHPWFCGWDLHENHPWFCGWDLHENHPWFCAQVIRSVLPSPSPTPAACSARACRWSFWRSRTLRTRLLQLQEVCVCLCVCVDGRKECRHCRWRYNPHFKEQEGLWAWRRGCIVTTILIVKSRRGCGHREEGALWWHTLLAYIFPTDVTEYHCPR